MQSGGAVNHGILTRKYLYTCVAGQPINSIYEGYKALFDYVKQNHVTLKSPTGYQFRTQTNGGVMIEIYLEAY